MIFIMVLSLNTVVGDVSLTSNETSLIGTEGFTLTVVTNETVDFEYWVSVNEDLSSPIHNSYAGNINATTHIYSFGSLTGGTTYYVQVNGTSNISNTEYSTPVIEVTTNAYQLTGVTRIILNIFVLIVLSIIVFGIFALHFGTSTTNDENFARKLISSLIISIIAVLVLNTWIRVILGL